MGLYGSCTSQSQLPKIAAKKLTSSLVNVIYEQIGLKQYKVNFAVMSDLSIQGLRFLLTNEHVSICTCQNKDSGNDQQSIQSMTHFDNERETLKILDFMIPMSVLGLVCEKNVPTLEKLSMVLSGHVSCQVSQHDLSEMLTNQMTLLGIKHRILHAIVPAFVGISSSHVSIALSSYSNLDFLKCIFI